MNKKKVLIVIHQLNFGGVQKSLIPALNAIDYDKNDVTLYVRKDRLELLPYINSNVSRVIINRDRTRYYRKPYSVLLLFLMKLKLLFKQDTTSVNNRLKEYVLKQQMKYEKKHYFKEPDKFDVAIAYIQRFPAMFVADYIKADRKIMFYRNSSDEEHDLHQRIMSSFDRIICVSNGAKNILSTLYPDYKAKIDYLESFVVADEVRRLSDEFTVDAPKDKTIICSCGRFTTVKGFDIAVDAAKVLKDKGFDFIWYFVGDGVERINIEKRITDNDLNNNIIITGMQDNPYPYLKCCDLFVQPSREESYGRTIKEALVLNKPVVSTKTIGGIEQIRDCENGVLSDISYESLALKIESLLNNDIIRGRIINQLKNMNYTEEFEKYKHKLNDLLKG